MKPLLAITMGDVNGVGPEIIVRAFARHNLWEHCTPIVFGCPQILSRLATREDQCPPIRCVEDLSQIDSDRRAMYVKNCGETVPPYRPGRLDVQAARCAMGWFEEAVRLVTSHLLDGIVTCPINKEGIHRAGYKSSGHTDHLAKLVDCDRYWMCLIAENMRVLHLTGHMSLSEAIASVRQDRIVEAIHAAHEGLAALGTSQRRIAVAGLNPHAGEGGAFGREEIEEVVPAIRSCQGDGIECFGPYAADTLFRRMRGGEFDMVVALYHDQGHIPVKLIAMDTGVNVTLGIPIVRTSVDHGTAYDIAGTGKACEKSLVQAIGLAARMAQRKAVLSG